MYLKKIVDLSFYSNLIYERNAQSYPELLWTSVFVRLL